MVGINHIRLCGCRRERFCYLLCRRQLIVESLIGILVRKRFLSAILNLFEKDELFFEILKSILIRFLFEKAHCESIFLFRSNLLQLFLICVNKIFYLFLIAVLNGFIRIVIAKELANLSVSVFQFVSSSLHVLLQLLMLLPVVCKDCGSGRYSYSWKTTKKTDDRTES